MVGRGFQGWLGSGGLDRWELFYGNVVVVASFGTLLTVGRRGMERQKQSMSVVAEKDVSSLVQWSTPMTQFGSLDAYISRANRRPMISSWGRDLNAPCTSQILLFQ